MPQAYRKHKQHLAVARGRFYDKLNNVSLGLSQQVVRASCENVVKLPDALGFRQWQGIDGYRLLAVDGNHLQRTDKRLAVVRDSKCAPLPGTAVARIDLGRHYCIVQFMQSIHAKPGCYFIIRQHRRLPGVLLGSRQRLGRTESGVVYEQLMRLTQDETSLIVRRVTIELDAPTQDGTTEVHVLTNLPDTVDSQTVMRQYHRRWEEETAFYYLRMCFNDELTSLGHPHAALFLFSLSVMAYNVLQLVLSAFYAVHDEETVLSLSNLYISQDISRETSGMLIVFYGLGLGRVDPGLAGRSGGVAEADCS